MAESVTQEVKEETSFSQEIYLLTTVDNPWNPFTHFDEWNAWDQAAGYNTLNLLARVGRTSPSLLDIDYHQAVQAAIDEVVKYNVSGMHRKVSEETANSFYNS